MTTAPLSSTTARPSRARSLVIATVVVVLLVVGVVLWRTTGHDEIAPYDDPQSAGLITLCSADGKAVTEGSVKDKPFADFAVGASGVPSVYDADGAVGTLFAYQPRKGVAASEFSGAPLTAAGLLADPEHPAVAISDRVWSVADFVSGYPATFDGYVQLRLILGTPGAGTLTEDPYDTADLKVDGDKWELIRGGTASCADASALVS